MQFQHSGENLDMLSDSKFFSHKSQMLVSFRYFLFFVVYMLLSQLFDITILMIYILTYTYAHIHTFPPAKLSCTIPFFQIHGLLYILKYINTTFCTMLLACMFSKMIICCTTHQCGWSSTEKTISPAFSVLQLALVLCVGLKPPGLLSVCISMFIVVVHFLSIFSLPFYLNFCEL